MKKNKTIAYLLAASLLVGGSIAGTMAWFTDSATVDNSLIVTMGSLDLTVVENPDSDGNETVTGWIKKSNQQDTIESPEADGSGAFSTVRPGDWFERVFTVENTGTLEQSLNIKGILKQGNITCDAKDVGDLIVDITSNKQEMNLHDIYNLRLLMPGEKITITLKADLDAEALNDEHNSTTEKHSLTFETLEKITINAEQINQNPNKPTPFQ